MPALFALRPAFLMRKSRIPTAKNLVQPLLRQLRFHAGFVLSALSANPVAASNSAGMPLHKSNPEDSRQPTGGSPFAVMLAATAQQQDSKPQAGDIKPAPDSDAPASAGKIKTADTGKDASSGKTKSKDTASDLAKSGTAKPGTAKPGTAKTADANKSRDAGKSSPKTADAAKSQGKTSDTGATVKSADAPAQISGPSSFVQTASEDQGGTVQDAGLAEKSSDAANDNQADAPPRQVAEAQQPAAPPAPIAAPQAQLQAQLQLAAQLPAPPQTPQNNVPANDDSSDDQQAAAVPGISGNPPAPAAATPAVPAAANIPAPAGALSRDTSLPETPASAPHDAAPARAKPVLQGDQTAIDKPADNRPAPQTMAADPANTGKSQPQEDTHKGNPVSVSSVTDKPGAQIASPAAAPQTLQASLPPQSQSAPPPAAPNFTALSAPAPVLPVQAMTMIAPNSSVHLSAPAPGAAPDIDGLAVEIAARSQSGAKEFSIRLDPPELGHVEIRLSIDAGGKAQAHMTVDHPDTLNLLQKDSTTLTQALRDAGLDVSPDGINFSMRGQGGQHSQNGDNAQSRASRSNITASRVIDNVQSASSIPGAGGNGRLDIHV
jgi:flagellar hook-length control protein FliK